MSPQFSILNGQIKTPWRWYDSPYKLASQNEPCIDQMGGCPHALVLCAEDRLPPFQIPRPNSVLGVTEWRLYDADGIEVVDLDGEIGLLEVAQFAGYDYVTYDGSALSTVVAPGIYTARIVTGGNTYYSEPFVVTCQTNPEACSMRLEWGNCGNVGNTYYAGGWMGAFWLAPRVVPVQPTPTVRIESEEQASGEIVETWRRKEVRYTILLGQVPWYIADALSDLALVDTVRLYPLGTDTLYDTLRNVQVAVEYDTAMSECLAEVRITFEIDAAAVACCEEYAAPCAEPCIEADGFVSETSDPVPTGLWIYDDQPAYIDKRPEQGPVSIICTSGFVVVTSKTLLGPTRDAQTYWWSIELGAWLKLAEIESKPDCAGEGATLECSGFVINVLPGYTAQLQYWNGFNWIDTDWPAMTQEEWDEWDEVLPCNLMLGFRLKVFSGDCVAGYSQGMASCQDT